MAIKKQAIVCHSGGMDSSICLALAIREFGAENVLSMSFSYGQRHSIELTQSAKICQAWQVDHVVLNVGCLQEITESALIGSKLAIKHEAGQVAPTTLVVGRNGLMGRLAAIHADHIGANCIYMGVIEVESASSGYRDCSRAYMDLLQEILRIDLDNSQFEIRTPVVGMTKCETMEVAAELGILEFLLMETVTCYRGILHAGCNDCAACHLRNQGSREFLHAHSDFIMPYQLPN